MCVCECLREHSLVMSCMCVHLEMLNHIRGSVAMIQDSHEMHSKAYSIYWLAALQPTCDPCLPFTCIVFPYQIFVVAALEGRGFFNLVLTTSYNTARSAILGNICHPFSLDFHVQEQTETGYFKSNRQALRVQLSHEPL